MARYSDPSDAMYKAYAIDIFSVTSKKAVNFKAFITNFTDSFTCNWNSETGVGRMDPIQTFQNTTRTITLDFDVVASSLAEAKQNLLRCQRLAQMLYPTFQTPSSAGTKAQIGASMAAPPYFKVKFSNLISRDGTGGGPGIMGNAARASGLFCTIGGMDYSPDFDVGVFTENGKIYPKYVPITLELTIMHDHALGWSLNGKSRDPNFSTFPWGGAAREVAQSAFEEAGLSEEGVAIAGSMIDESKYGGDAEIAAINANSMLADNAEREAAQKAHEQKQVEAEAQKTAPESTMPPTQTPIDSQAAKQQQADSIAHHFAPKGSGGGTVIMKNVPK